MIFNQKSFGGGLNFLVDDSQIRQDEYVWVINARNRFNRLEPIRKHVEQVIPEGILQGGISVGNILIIFISGSAYYQIDGSTIWNQIPGFAMDPSTSLYYACAVPSSTQNFVRKRAATGSIKDPILLTTDFKVNGTPQCIVVQDTINQPWLIFYDTLNNIFTSRVSKNYAQWDNTNSINNSLNREYVPIGRQMIMVNNTLYVVSQDKKVMYRSITGRPLDFMVNVDIDGNKAPSENNGGARTVSQAFDFDDITCLQNIDIPDSFIWGTKKYTRIVTADYNNTIFDEPTFRESAIISAGIVNQNSFTSGLNDFVQIEAGGIKSFNSVQQLKFRGNNSIFSLQLSRLLQSPITRQPIKQTDCAVVAFNNYLLFNIDTSWGNLIAVYDNLKEAWSALDITKVSKVKQFVIVETDEQLKLYALCDNNELYQMFAGEDTEIPQLRVRAFVTQETNKEHKSIFLRPMFNGGTFDGEAVLREFVDSQESLDNYSRKPLKVITGGIKYPVIPPVIPNTEVRVENPSFNLTQGILGKKITFILQWTNDSNLVELQLDTSEQQNNSSSLEQQQTMKDTYGTSGNN